MRILAVDDDPIMLDLLGNVLEDGGFNDITFAAGAEDALELVEVSSKPYDTFLLDVMLPETNGIEVCKVIRSYPKYHDCPIIMVTGSRARGMMASAFEAGATDFVNKPFDALELITRIRLAAMLSAKKQQIPPKAVPLKEHEHLTEVSFDARLEMPSNPGVQGFLALENELLRREDQLEGIQLFSIQVDDALGVYRCCRPAQFRVVIEAVARILSGVLDTDTTRFSYAGRGDMFGMIQSCDKTKLQDLQERANGALKENWARFSTGQMTGPTLTFQYIEGPPIWTGKAAADAMRSFQGRAHLTQQAGVTEVNGLFERLSGKIRAGQVS
ncbi:MAG: response regulator [Sulfitobacter sp.]